MTAAEARNARLNFLALRQEYRFEMFLRCDRIESSNRFLFASKVRERAAREANRLALAAARINGA